MEFTRPWQYHEHVASNVPKSEDKPVVHYARSDWPLEVGERAAVVPIDHPAVYLNNQIAYTSAIQSIAENGVDFETRNTKYVYKP